MKRFESHTIPALVLLAAGAVPLLTGTGIVTLNVTAAASGAAQAAAAAPASILEGAPNFRDIGGYATGDGRHVRKGLVYRSGQLSALTAADYDRLNTLGIRLVCDFRTNGERERQPTRWQGGPAPEMMRAQIMKEQDVNMSGARMRELTANASAASSLASSYENMVAPEPAAEYGRLYKQIAEGHVPVIAHCSAGKDRTGVFSAVLLTMLGVPRATVVDDYMLTEAFMMSPKALARATADMQKMAGGEGLDEKTVKAIYTMHAEVITNTFATIDRRYGSFEAFVRDGLKLTPADVAGLKQNLLE